LPHSFAAITRDQARQPTQAVTPLHISEHPFGRQGKLPSSCRSDVEVEVWLQAGGLPTVQVRTHSGFSDVTDVGNPGMLARSPRLSDGGPSLKPSEIRAIASKDQAWTRLRHRPTGAQRMSQRRSVRHPATSRGAELLWRNVPFGAKAIHIASCNPCHNHRQQFPASACTKLTAALLVCDRLQCEAAHIWRKIFGQPECPICPNSTGLSEDHNGRLEHTYVTLRMQDNPLL
jgi:hypothetical protein